MTGLSALLLGLGLGLRHATDSDHVVAVTALLQRQPGTWRAARIAAWWGVGHSATIFCVGAILIAGGLRMPPHLERVAELLVACMLLGLGGVHCWRAWRWEARRGGAGDGAGGMVRPALVGLVHGLAGSAGVALLASMTFDERSLAIAYLALFGLGSALGMVMLTVVLAWPMSWALRRRGAAPRWIAAVAGGLGVALGVAILAEVLAHAWQG